MAQHAKVNVGETSIDAKVDLPMNAKNLLTLAVALHADLPGATPEQAEDIVTQAH